MTRSSSMTSCPVLRCLAPRLPVLSVGFGSVFCSMPLGRIAGPPVTPLTLTIPARKSATTCFSAAFSASRRSVRASRSPRDSSERGIFSGTDMLGTNRVRYEQGQPRSSSYLPGFLPQVQALSHCFYWVFQNEGMLEQRLGISWCLEGSRRGSCEVAKRSSQVGKIRKVVMDRRFSKNPPPSSPSPCARDLRPDRRRYGRRKRAGSGRRTRRKD